MCVLKTMVTRRWAGFAIGLLSFTASHAIEVAMWDSWFGGTHDPWFLNSGRAAAFTMGCLFAASSVAGGLRLSGWPIGAGAVMAMAAVLMWGGGSTIFPIVLAA